jgi:hypothetical protein
VYLDGQSVPRLGLVLAERHFLVSHRTYLYIAGKTLQKLEYKGNRRMLGLISTYIS